MPFNQIIWLHVKNYKGKKSYVDEFIIYFKLCN